MMAVLAPFPSVSPSANAEALALSIMMSGGSRRDAAEATGLKLEKVEAVWRARRAFMRARLN